MPAQVEDRLARPVARQLGLGAVGVEDAQAGDEAGLVGVELMDALALAIEQHASVAQLLDNYNHALGAAKAAALLAH